ncbi:KIF15 [Symbiodinium sp. CCMP2456]|nr:KIF15 [Symbiodinium sp. CCMP2456]
MPEGKSERHRRRSGQGSGWCNHGLRNNDFRRQGRNTDFCHRGDRWSTSWGGCYLGCFSRPYRAWADRCLCCLRGCKKHTGSSEDSRIPGDVLPTSLCVQQREASCVDWQRGKVFVSCPQQISGEGHQLLAPEVAGYRTSDFPAFFTPRSGLATSCSVDGPEEAAEVLAQQRQACLGSGMVLAVPVPESLAAEGARVEEATRTAVEESTKLEIRGNEVTPFLLKRINELTGGESLRSNIALIKHNAEVGAAVALELAKRTCGICGNSIRVHIRVRPPTEREIAVGSAQAVFVDGSSVIVKSDPPRSFAFDGVLGESSSQQDVFESLGRMVGSSCLAGYNGSVYVYGQTGAGKTHTMCGPITSVQSMQFDERRGIICRMLDYVFSEVARRGTEDSGVEHSCRCSFLEIYKEQVTDLLEPANTNLQVREDMNRGVYVERLSEVTVGSLTEAFQALWRGLQQRQVGSTHMNERSSRSHAVFTLYVEAARTRAGVTSTRVASLSMVDLAGSERQQHLGDPGTSTVQPYEALRVREAGAINKSLSALTNVIMSLSREERSRKRSGDGRRSNYVHYRDSKLTFLLRDSLGGNSKTVLVANVSPSQLCLSETLSTLKFAARAKHIRCTVVRNEAFSGTVESLMEEVQILRNKLAQLSGRSFDRTPVQSQLMSPGSISEGVEDEPEAEDVGFRDAANNDLEEQSLSDRQRIARLEVLLSAALEREASAEQRRFRLKRLANFLEDLDFRKCHRLRKLHAEYVSQLAPQVEGSAIADDMEVRELSAKLKSFGHLLGNLTRGARLEDGDYGYGAGMDSDAQSTEASSGTPMDSIEDQAAISGDEAKFIREENRMLRRQLENHPEVQRMIAENWALREELRALDPTGWPRVPGQPVSPAGLGDGERALPSPPSISSEVLASVEADDESSSKTWFYFQKMAKEVEELMRAKESLSRAIERTQRDPSGASQGVSSMVQSLTSQPAKEASGAVPVSSVVELDIATQEALKQAQGLLQGPGCARLPAVTAAGAAGRRGAKEVDDGRSPERGFGPPEQVGTAPCDDEERFKQAVQRIQQLQGTVDLISAAYGDAFDEFQRLREEYESRLEECQFFELQCSRLNLTCLDLAERLSGGKSAMRPRPGFSTTGLWHSQSAVERQKRSFSMSSLRDATFWQQRFEELRELTGADPLPEDLSVTETPASSESLHSSTPWMLGDIDSGNVVQSSSLSALRSETRPQMQYAGTSASADDLLRRVCSAPVLAGSMQASTAPVQLPCSSSVSEEVPLSKTTWATPRAGMAPVAACAQAQATQATLGQSPQPLTPKVATILTVAVPAEERRSSSVTTHRQVLMLPKRLNDASRPTSQRATFPSRPSAYAQVIAQSPPRSAPEYAAVMAPRGHSLPAPAGPPQSHRYRLQAGGRFV